MLRCLFLLRLATAALPTEAEVYAGVIADVDRNGDGRIDAAEYARVGDAADVATIDVDRSGDIDAPELAAYTGSTPVALRVVHAGPGVRAPAATPPAAPDGSRGVWIGAGVAGALLAGASAAWLGRRGGRRRRGRG